jgi:hypothetical protein
VCRQVSLIEKQIEHSVHAGQPGPEFVERWCAISGAADEEHAQHVVSKFIGEARGRRIVDSLAKLLGGVVANLIDESVT